MSHLFNIKKNFIYYFLFIFLILGIFLSLKVGITHDEYHDFFVGEANKKKFLSFFLGQEYSPEPLTGLNRYYGWGFHLLSTPIEKGLGFFLEIDHVTLESKSILLKHPSVFLFFIISGLYLKKIIFLITKDKNYSSICLIFYLTYPYLLGHSFFNIKDIPFLSVWLVCTFYIINIANYYYKSKKINNKYLIILAFLTSYLFSIRISGILILIEYLIFLLFMINISKKNYFDFFKEFYKKIFIFSLIVLIIFYFLSPSYWNNPLDIIKGIKAMTYHIQTVCTITLGDCMKAQSLPSTYLPIWFFFKLPVIILFGLFYLIFIEKKFFLALKNKLLVAPILVSIFTILFLLISLNINLYDEIRQVMFIVPLFFITSLISIYYLPKKTKYFLLSLSIIFFILQNIKIYPYNYIWLNNLASITNVSKNFELDYWGVASKEIASHLKDKDIIKNECIVSNRNRGIKDFILKKDICFIPFKNLHTKKERPFYVILTERSLSKGLPNNCQNIYNEKISINFSKEELILGKVFKCT